AHWKREKEMLLREHLQEIQLRETKWKREREDMLMSSVQRLGQLESRMKSKQVEFESEKKRLERDSRNRELELVERSEKLLRERSLYPNSPIHSQKKFSGSDSEDEWREMVEEVKLESAYKMELAKSQWKVMED